MSDKHNEEKSFVVTGADGKPGLALDVFLRTLIQQCMGKSLDLARISGMSDRSLQQFERTTKDEYYQIIEYGIKILKENGYITDDGK